MEWPRYIDIAFVITRLCSAEYEQPAIVTKLAHTTSVESVS